MFIITIANRSGGVGKTTTTVSLAGALALSGWRVLLIDADPQGNATNGVLAPESARAPRSLADVLLTDPEDGGGLSLLDAISETRVDNLSVVAAGAKLSKFEREDPDAVVRLQECLAARELRRRYDFVLIDTPPSFGLLLSAALTAATHVVVPVQAEPKALESIVPMMRTVTAAQRLNRKLAVLGAVCTMLDERTRIGGEAFAAIKNLFPGPVFDTAINRQVRLSEGPARHMPIQFYAPSSRGAVQYGALAEEVLKRLGTNGHAGARGARGAN